MSTPLRNSLPPPRQLPCHRRAPARPHLPTVWVMNCVDAACLSCSSQDISTMRQPSAAKNCRHAGQQLSELGGQLAGGRQARALAWRSWHADQQAAVAPGSTGSRHEPSAAQRLWRGYPPPLHAPAELPLPPPFRPHPQQNVGARLALGVLAHADLQPRAPLPCSKHATRCLVTGTSARALPTATHRSGAAS